MYPASGIQHPASSTATGPANEAPRSRRLPQFRLRTLFLVVTLLGALFGVMHAVGPIASVGLLLLLTLIGLHVAGNALGTSLRDESTAQTDSRPRRLAGDPTDRQTRALPSAHRLRERTPLGWIIRATAFLGAVAGSVIGAVGFDQWTSASMPGLVVGATSAGVLGGLFGFLAGSFFEITLLAWWQATHEASANGTHVQSAFRRSPLPSLRADVPPALVADLDAG